MDRHEFNDPQDPTKGGTWYDDHGRRFCIWYWDAETKMVAVIRGTRGKRIKLIGIGEQHLKPEVLRNRFPQLALEAAQLITEEG